MQFRTIIPICQSDFKIDYNSKVVTLGSCFAVNMSQKLDYFKFENTCNPFGILFHPLAIEKLVDFAISGKQFTNKDVFFHNEQWHCFHTHSDLSNSNREDLISNLNAKITAAKQQLQQATHVIITYGTSWVYRNIAANKVVANCHKVTQREFSKEILSIETIENSIQNTIDLIQKVNPNCNFIFTVSPVRHLKDGFVENQVSKANLLIAIYRQLQTEHCKVNTAYFPSYEIMMDELRDYRFYSDDMIHPNAVAIDYIWQRFSDAFITVESHSMMNEVETIQKGLAHRPFNPNSQSHQEFLSKLQDKMDKLLIFFPHIQF